MTATLEILAAFAPGLLWLWFVYSKDDRAPEPRHLVARVFALGCLSAAGVLLVRPRLDGLVPVSSGWAGHVVDAFLVTAAHEEAWKIAALLVGVYWHHEFDEPMDGIVYGAAAGLGFASVENAAYLLQTQDWSLVWMRAFTSTLAHVCFSGGLGFFLARARLERGRSRAAGYVAAGAATSVGGHGLYDLLLVAYPGWSLVALLGVLPGLLIALSVKIRWARSRSMIAGESDAKGA